MIGFVLLLLVLVLLGVGSYLGVQLYARRLDLRIRELQAQRTIDDLHRRTKHAMNDAAGQSWRNLAG